MPIRFDADRFADVPELRGSGPVALASDLLLVASHVARLPYPVRIARDLLARAHAMFIATAYGTPDAGSDPSPAGEAATTEGPTRRASTASLAELDDEFALLSPDEDLPPTRAAGTPLAETARIAGADDGAELAPIFLDAADADGASPITTIVLRPAAAVRAEAQRRRKQRTVLVRQIAFYAETVAAFVDETRPATRVLAERLLAAIAERNDAGGRRTRVTSSSSVDAMTAVRQDIAA